MGLKSKETRSRLLILQRERAREIVHFRKHKKVSNIERLANARRFSSHVLPVSAVPLDHNSCIANT